MSILNDSVKPQIMFYENFIHVIFSLFAMPLHGKYALVKDSGYVKKIMVRVL